MRYKHKKKMMAFLLAAGMSMTAFSAPAQAAETGEAVSSVSSSMQDPEQENPDTGEENSNINEADAGNSYEAADDGELQAESSSQAEMMLQSETDSSLSDTDLTGSSGAEQEEDSAAEEEKEMPAVLEVRYRDGSQLVYAVTLSSYTLPEEGGKIVAAVWSEEKGQDDLKWYTLSEESSGYTAEVHMEKHKTSGSYYVHLYLQQKDGSMVFIDQTVFTTEPVSVGSMEIIQDKENLSEAALLLHDVTCPSGVQKILVPVWSRSDQKDIHWYSAEKVQEGQWKADLKYSRHPSSAGGSFHVHVYGTNGAGAQDFIGSEQVTLRSAEPALTVSPGEDGLKIRLTDCSVQKPKSVTVAVWSARNGQDDLKWYSASGVTAGTAEISVPSLSETGLYYIHCYAKDSSGKMHFQSGTEYENTVPVPAAESVSAELSKDGSALQLQVLGVSSPDQIRQVSFAVWSAEKGQDDLHWYTAKKKKGKFSAQAPLKNHKGSGLYYVHVYADDSRGESVFLGKTEVTVALQAEAVIRTEDFSEERFSADFFVDLGSCSMKVIKTELAVWSASDQSDIFWYRAAEAGEDTWHAAFTPLKHRGNTGTFHVHVYVTFENGTRIFAGETEYTLAIRNQTYFTENSDGTVTAVLYTPEKKGTVNVAVWSAEKGQDDVKWYPMSWNGSCYEAVLSIRNHKHNGSYYGHFYSGGTMLGSGTFAFPEYLSVTEHVSSAESRGKGDAKFFKGKLLCTSQNTTTLLNMDGTVFRTYPNILINWMSVLEEEGLIVYSNWDHRLGLIRMNSDYSIAWNRTIAVTDNLTIDPSIIKTGNGYLVTGTEIAGKVNNSDPAVQNGVYTVSTWSSSDLKNWSRKGAVVTEASNLEDVDMVEKDGVLYIVYEKETVDKGNSSIVVQTSSDQGKTWSAPKELLPADCDHEPAIFSVNGDRFVLFYSSDKDAVGSSYMGGKAYYAVFDSSLNCIARDVEIKTAAKGGILWYDVTWIDATHYILYAENYLTTGTLVVEKGK